MKVERRSQPDETVIMEAGGARAMVTPPIDEEYWAYRVQVSPTQAVVAFPKFMTMGIGFAVEDVDWNTNLPWTVAASEIYQHISKNRGTADPGSCLRAIEMIQGAIREDGAADPGWRTR